jgi:hypothetical protein
MLLFFVAVFQLRNIVRTNEIKMVLDIESELHSRKTKIDETSSKIRVAGDQNNHSLVEIYDDDLEAFKESYFNALDRFCYCILKDYLKDRDWKKEYGDLIRTTVRENEGHFGTGTYYKNLKKIYEKWNN